MTHDTVQRFFLEELDLRGRLVVLDAAWRSMLEGRRYPAPLARLLGHACALAVLLAVGRKDRVRLTLQVIGSGPVRLLVSDCDADLRIRGMAQADDGPLEGSERSLLGDGRLALNLEDAAGAVYQSLIPLEGASMEAIFEHYLAQSEQRAAFLRLHADDACAVGLLLEKLPGADARDPDGWARLTHLAATLRPEEARGVPAQTLLARLFPGELLRVLASEAVRYHCPYDPAKVEGMLRGLGREEVDSILADKGEVVIRNEMCNHVYRFDAAAIETLFAGARDADR